MPPAAVEGKVGVSTEFGEQGRKQRKDHHGQSGLFKIEAEEHGNAHAPSPLLPMNNHHTTTSVMSMPLFLNHEPPCRRLAGLAG